MRVQQTPADRIKIEALTQMTAERLYDEYAKFERECLKYFMNRKDGRRTLPQMNALWLEYEEEFENVESFELKAHRSELYSKMNVTADNYNIAENAMGEISWAQDEPEPNQYVAYFCSDDEDKYMNMILTFHIQDKELKIGYLARLMQGLVYYLLRPPSRLNEFEFPRPDLMVRKVIGFARKQGATEITMQPVGPGSLAMWHRLAVDPDMDPFYDETSQKDKAEQDRDTIHNASHGKRFLFDLDMFKMAMRICSSCDWFAAHTCDHPKFQNKAFFCGQPCLERFFLSK